MMFDGVWRKSSERNLRSAARVERRMTIGRICSSSDRPKCVLAEVKASSVTRVTSLKIAAHALSVLDACADAHSWVRFHQFLVLFSYYCSQLKLQRITSHCLTLSAVLQTESKSCNVIVCWLKTLCTRSKYDCPLNQGQFALLNWTRSSCFCQTDVRFHC